MSIEHPPAQLRPLESGTGTGTVQAQNRSNAILPWVSHAARSTARARRFVGVLYCRIVPSPSWSRAMHKIIVAALAFLLWLSAATAQELVHFPSLDGTTQLDGYLYRPSGEGRRPAIVGLHGCSGMFNRSGAIFPIFREWAAELTRQGYVFLLVDSFRPRNHGEMCSILGFELDIYRARPRDAYGALWYLQAQPFVRGDRIGLLGWSQGGGVTLFSIGAQSTSRPANLPQGDFRVAVAFYPASCNIQRQPSDWTTRIPLLVLIGAEDVWA